MRTSSSSGGSPPAEAAAPKAEREPIPRQAWVALGVILGGTYMVVIDTTVLGVALPSIASELQAGAGVDWVVTTYLMAFGLVQPATGWASDRWGKKNVYLASLGLFTAGSVAAAVAPTFELLLAARLLQGLGGGAMQPVGMAMVYRLFPADRRGMALGMWGLAIMAAPALGPPLGGWVTQAWSWRWIFAINLPIGLLVAWAGRRKLHDPDPRVTRPLDHLGWLLGAAGVILLVVSSRFAPEWGFTSPALLGLGITGMALLAWLVARSLRATHPVLNFELFKIPTFSVSMALVGLMVMAQFGRLTYLPVELAVVRGLTSDEIGLLLVPSAIAVAITMPIGGRLADVIGARVPVTVGWAAAAYSTFELSRLTPETSLTFLVAVLVIGGLGTGLAIMPNTVAAMNSLPTQYVAHATVIRSLLRQLSGAIGTAILGAVLVAALGSVQADGVAPAVAQEGYNQVFRVTFWFLVGTVACGLFLPGRRLTKEHQAARAAEYDEVPEAVQP